MFLADDLDIDKGSPENNLTSFKLQLKFLCIVPVQLAVEDISLLEKWKCK